ncbi:nuclear transport factor 2 family protein [Duganella callida]|uniref:Nuclear transport factor 2 family protein n=1 Tax=Duganella callida TaxID=2561932 RepID=A0A4Y9SEI6_9BURK|nr:nuclear transport factor 2 family protein [Duganella callida]TFW21538.1 nuclear transport factor 2 family protein [Duganella callida]
MKKLIAIGAMLAASLAHAQQSDEVAVAQQLINRHFELWGDRNPEHWDSKFAQVYTADVMVADYGDMAVGYASLAHLIARVQADHPGFAFRPDPVAWNHGIGRVTWSYGPKDNPGQVHGEDIFTIKDGKLSSLRVFIDKK